MLGGGGMKVRKEISFGQLRQHRLDRAIHEMNVLMKKMLDGLYAFLIFQYVYQQKTQLHCDFSPNGLYKRLMKQRTIFFTVLSTGVKVAKWNLIWQVEAQSLREGWFSISTKYLQQLYFLTSLVFHINFVIRAKIENFLFEQLSTNGSRQLVLCCEKSSL